MPLILLFVLFYFLLIRPQQVQQRRRQEMLSRLKQGDRVITIGGIHGTITTVAEDRVRLQISDNVELELNKSGVGMIKGEDSQ